MPHPCLGLVRRNPSGPAVMQPRRKGRTHDRTRSVSQIKQNPLRSRGRPHMHHAMSMRYTFLVMGPIYAALAGVASAQGESCPDCDAAFALSRPQLSCIGQRIDALLRRPGDPVYFDAAGCGTVNATMGGGGNTYPPIVPPPPSKSNASKWLRLSKIQLRCFKEKLAAIEAKPGDPGEVSLALSDCAQAP